MWVYDIVKNVTIVENQALCTCPVDKNNKDSFYTFAKH